MSNYIVFIGGKEKLIELGFKELGKNCYYFPIREHHHIITFFESKYNNNEYVLEILDSGFPDNENTYENLYNFVLENKDKNEEFWSYDKKFDNGLELNGLSNYFLDSKDGNVVSKEIKSEHSRYLGSLYKHAKDLLNIDDIENEDRSFYTLSKLDIVDPLIKVLDYIELVDLDIKYKDYNNDNEDFER